MEDNFKIETDLYSLIKRGTNAIEIIKAIKEYGINKPLKDGTPLYFATTYGKIEVVAYLTDNGAEINALFDNHYTPLMSAVDNNSQELVALLLEKSADISLTDKHGNNALWKAIFNNNLPIVKLLIKAGAKPFEVIKDGWSLYDGAKHMELTEIVTYFDLVKSQENTS
jgi:ankyrin repeat protein